MRLLGQGQHPANVTITTESLMQMALTSPEVMWNSFQLYESNYTMFSSLLARKGLTASALYGDVSGKGNIQAVGNRAVKWSIKPPPIFKGKVLSHTGGATPGLNGAFFEVVVDSDKFRENHVLQMVDQRTLLFVQSKRQIGLNSWGYTVSVKGNLSGYYADPTLLTAGKEVGTGHTSYPEMSSDASEAQTGMEWHTNYLTIQRAKYTMSGSARATRIPIEHNGLVTWESQANLDMMQHWYRIQEDAYLFGRATVDENMNYFLRDMDGQPVISGDGLIASGDNGLKFGYNRLTEQFLNTVLYNMSHMGTENGMYEFAVLGGKDFCWDFSALMRDTFAAAPQVLFEERGGERGVKTAFTFYQPMPNIRMYVMEHPSFSSPYLPTETINGRNPRAGRGIFVQLGNLIGGQGGANIQLVALANGSENRSMIMRGVPGMAGPGLTSTDGRVMGASAVDGWQMHVLSETGIIVRNPLSVAEVFRYRV